MHDIRWIRDNPEAFDRGLKRRGLDGQSAALIALDDHRRELVQTLQEAQARRNAASKEIGAAMGAGDRAHAEQLKAEVAALKDRIAVGRGGGAPGHRRRHRRRWPSSPICRSTTCRTAPMPTTIAKSAAMASRRRSTSRRSSISRSARRWA